MALSAQLGGAGMLAQKLETTATLSLEKMAKAFPSQEPSRSRRHHSRRRQSKFDAAVKAAETGCPVSKLFKAEILSAPS